MKKMRLLPAALLSGLVLLLPTPLLAHPDVPLRDAAGQVIPAAGIDAPLPAYSSRTTCGGCHDYDQIERNSFHAQTGANQIFGWDQWNPDAADTFQGSDIPQDKPWIQSPGHFGSSDPPAARQLARMFDGPSGQSAYDALTGQFDLIDSNNGKPHQFGDIATFRKEVDMSVPGNLMDCAECHVGGGAMELVPNADMTARTSLRDIVSTDVNGFGPVTSSQITAFNYFVDIYDVDGDTDRNEVLYMDYGLTGVLEMDCFICHLSGYDYAARKASLRRGKLDASRAIGAGLATDNGLTWDNINGPAAGFGTTVQYGAAVTIAPETTGGPNLLWLSSDFFATRVNTTPAPANCAFCHAQTFATDWKKRGDNWREDGSYEVHYLFGCLGCHGRTDGIALHGDDIYNSALYPQLGAGQVGHDPAKGDVPFNHVMEENDMAGFKGCEGCHLRGGDGAEAFAAPDPTLLHQQYGLTARIVQDGEYDGVADSSHIDLIECAACHVRKLSDEPWNTGGGLADATGADITGHLFDYINQWVIRNNMSDRSALAWYKGRLIRTGILSTLLWRDANPDFDVNLDGLSGGYDPLLQTQVLATNRSHGWNAISADTAGQITAAAINERIDAFNSDMDAWQGTSGQADTRFSLMIIPFQVNHNVTPKRFAFGANGCVDCHAPGASFFSGSVNPLGDATSIYWDDDRTPYTLVNGQTAASDYDPGLRDKASVRSLAVEFADATIDIDTDSDGTPETYGTVRHPDRSELLWEMTFQKQADFASSYSGSAIDLSGDETGWLVKIEASSDGGQTIQTRTRQISANVTSITGLISDLGGFASGDFEFTLGDNGSGGLLLTGQNGYLVRLHSQSSAGPLGLAGALWRPAPIRGMDGNLYNGRTDWLAYLRTLSDPTLAGLGSGPLAEITTIDGSGASTPVDIILGQSVELAAAGQIGPGSVDYHWYINDGLGVNGTTGSPSELFSGQTINHTFSKKGTWTVTLKVIDEEGNVAQTFQKVNVTPGTSDITVTPSYNGATGVTTLSISGLPVDTDILYILYGDGSKEKVEGVVLAGDTATVTHTFSDNDQFEVDPGVYTYKVSIYAFDAGVRLEANSQSISIDTN